MTTSEPLRETFVWMWLPEADEPVVAGRLEAHGDIIEFNYGQSFLSREDAEPAVLDPRTYLLLSGSDRIGALDFQESPNTYVSRHEGRAQLEELLKAANLVDRRLPLPPALDRALLHGSSVGGARPKALLEDGDRKLIAKFSSSGDTYPVVQAEFVAMELPGGQG